MLRSEHRLDSLLSRESIFLANNVVLVALCFVIFWGTYFPLISEALTGQEASVGPPWFDRYTVPLALVLVLLSGIGPVIAWRRATLRQRPAQLPRAAGRLADRAGRAARRGRVAEAVRDRDVLLRGVRVRQHRAGVPSAACARGGRWPARAPPVALLALVRRNRRRYGGYIVHIGIAVLFVGVAASSSFQHAVEQRLSPGSSARVGAYTIRYVRPTATVTPKNDAAHTGSTLSLGAVVDVSKHGHHVATLRPSEGFYDSGEPAQGHGRAPDRRSGRQPHQHERRRHARRVDGDRPDISAPALARIVTVGNRTLPADEAVVALGFLARAYLKNPPPAQFHFIVSPLVMWIWIGGLIVFGGGLIAIWPAPSAVRRRVALRSRARSAHGLARA